MTIADLIAGAPTFALLVSVVALFAPTPTLTTLLAAPWRFL